jgi:hypothetical protein
MAQQVNSVPNPNYVVTPLTTVAGSIVSRRRLKVPANLSGTYSHGKSGLNSVITFDIADNECFVDLSKLVFCVDFYTDFPLNAPFPQFDGGVQSLVSRLTIGSSQGLKIEEINNYNVLSNMIQCITETNIHKEHNLSEYSSYSHTSQSVFNDSSTFYDSHGNYPTNMLRSGFHHRLHIRFHQSSFLNKFKLLPLFLFRNGIRIEIELDDLHKSFVYANSPSLVSMCRWPLAYKLIKGFTGEGEAKVASEAASVYLPSFQIIKHDGPLPLDSYFLPVNHRIVCTHSLEVSAQTVQEIYSKVHLITAANVSEECTTIIPFYIYLQENANSLEELRMSGFFLVHYKGNDITFTVASDANAYVNAYTEIKYDDVSDPEKAYLNSVIGKFPCHLNFDLLQKIGKFRFASLGSMMIGGSLFIDYNNMLSITNNVSRTFIVHGYNFTTKYWHGNSLAKLLDYTILNDLMGTYNTYKGYTIKNPELILDVIKPSADEFLKYTQAFQSPSGIPYNYKRIIYKSMQIDSPSSNSFLQLPLQLSVRSLTGILFTFQDQIAQFPTSNGNNDFFTYPCLSSFLRCGLVRYEVVVGGQQFPLYPLYIRRTQDGVEKNLVNESFILELENFFGVNGNAGVIPSISRNSICDTRNYGLCQTTPTGGENVTRIMDSSKSIFGLSLSKDDINNFAAGIDSSQSGSIILNLYFDDATAKEFGYLQFTSRPIKLNVFCFADAVFTLQSDANLVRY